MEDEKIKKKLQENIKIINDNFLNSKDLIVKTFNVCKTKCAIVYLKGLADVKVISEFVLKPAMENKNKIKGNFVEYIKTNIITFPEIEEVQDFKDMSTDITKGKAFVFLDGYNVALKLEVDSLKERSIQEPPTSAVLKGPREGFVENIKTNIALVKKILSTPNLKVENLKVGKQTNTIISVMFLDNIAEPEIVARIIERIKNINIDGVIDSYYVAQFLEEHRESIFKQVGSTEKPDVVAAKLLEGRVAILVDGSPIVLTLPFMLIEDLQSGDDYYGQHSHAKLVRVIRFISILITVLLPGMYIAIQLYHYKAIPLNFLTTIMNTTTGLPLTPFAEILFVLILFEVLYEASLRMPKYLGLALSVVGALILGDTAVKAGLISPPSVMIVALSGITLYTVPEQANQLSLLRFLNTLAGGVLGFYGMILINLFIIIYLNDFDSYGSAYLAPYAPRIKEDLKDAISKVDITNMKKRPKSIPHKNDIRQGGKK